MKKIRICCAALASVMALSLGGCKMIDDITGNNIDEASSVSSEAASTVEVKVVDKTLELPVFAKEFKTRRPVAMGSEFIIDAEAVVNDGGEVTYQWYVNNIDSNGGGTKIEGATDPIYKPETTELGVKFYYAVVENSKGNKYNMTTTPSVRVEVLKNGQWTVDEFGGTRYLADDGTYPANIQMDIDGNTYYFDQSGYRFSGWTYWDAYYFFDAEGKMAKDCQIDEYHFNEDGVMTDDLDPLGLFAPAEAAAQ